MEGIVCGVLYDLGGPNPRELYRSDERSAWGRIAGDWQRFQNHVAYMMLPKEPAKQHYILADLFHANYVTHIVSFNWDNLIERAYRDRYGTDITKVTGDDQDSDHALWKMHGDIENPSQRWVLPYEDGTVYPAIARRATKLKVRAFVVGYREQEPSIRELLIQPIEQGAGITRIRPDIDDNPPEFLCDNAATALKKFQTGLEAARRTATVS
ncbi:MAG: SIR2 family protein [Bacteroidetes bacterium]|nr:SIR2 family protein [Bacteroidota bacterium]MCL5025474.1 SIR2 family protein [Chloroflexota bacterium]